MARTLYGGTPGDVVEIVTPDDGDLALATEAFTVWNAATGGTQQTDLQKVDGTAVTTVTPDARGVLKFLGPNNYSSALWIQDSTGYRWQINPADLPNRAGLANGLPAGGVIGQLVGKTGAADYVVGYVDPPGGTADSTTVDTTSGLAGPSVQDALEGLATDIDNVVTGIAVWG